MRGFGWVGGVAVGVGGWVRGWLGVVVAMITGVGHACVCVWPVDRAGSTGDLDLPAPG